MDTDFDSIAHSLARIEETLARDTTRKAIEDIFTEQARLWQDHAALRDELHESAVALSNRIEGVKRGLTTHPAEVVERMIDRG